MKFQLNVVGGRNAVEIRIPSGVRAEVKNNVVIFTQIGTIELKSYEILLNEIREESVVNMSKVQNILGFLRLHDGASGRLVINLVLQSISGQIDLDDYSIIDLLNYSVINKREDWLYNDLSKKLECIINLLHLQNFTDVRFCDLPEDVTEKLIEISRIIVKIIKE